MDELVVLKIVLRVTCSNLKSGYFHLHLNKIFSTFSLSKVFSKAVFLNLIDLSYGAFKEFTLIVLVFFKIMYLLSLAP